MLFPSLCIGCSEKTSGDAVICDKCASTIVLRSSLFCGKCNARLPNGKKMCHFEYPYILGAGLDYRDKAVGAAIKYLKFKRDKRAATILGKFMAEYIKRAEFDTKSFFVLPVPLGRQRQRMRGFNQAELIAEVFAEKLDIPLLRDGLVKTKDTPAQSELKSRAERENNLTGAFRADGEIILGKNIILVDDVTTSGATFREATNALKIAGAKKILALAAAKA